MARRTADARSRHVHGMCRQVPKDCLTYPKTFGRSARDFVLVVGGLGLLPLSYFAASLDDSGGNSPENLMLRRLHRTAGRLHVAAGSLHGTAGSLHGTAGRLLTGIKNHFHCPDTSHLFILIWR